MQVRIRFGRGPVVTRRKGKNSGIARLAASFLTLAAISFFVLAAWRLGGDLGIAGDFAFSSGVLSHWQVWMAAAISTQYACWWLTRYARQGDEPAASILDVAGVPSPEADLAATGQAKASAAANM